MKKINYKKLNAFIASNIIQPFYEIRLQRLASVKLRDVIKRKNPYLFKAKNIEIAGDLAKNILDAFLSSQEETIFGGLMENFATYVCKQVFGGEKAEAGIYRSVDLIFRRGEKIYIVGIKSGPNWGNSDQVNAMRKNFKIAKKLLRAVYKKADIVAINGCMYGRDNQPHKINKKDSGLSYEKLCGQAFWELIAGDKEFYKKIIQPLDQEAKKRDEIFKKLYARKVNELTKSIIEFFYSKNILDWNKIIEHVSKK